MSNAKENRRFLDIGYNIYETMQPEEKSPKSKDRYSSPSLFKNSPIHFDFQSPNRLNSEKSQDLQNKNKDYKEGNTKRFDEKNSEKMLKNQNFKDSTYVKNIEMKLQLKAGLIKELKTELNRKSEEIEKLTQNLKQFQALKNKQIESKKPRPDFSSESKRTVKDLESKFQIKEKEVEDLKNINTKLLQESKDYHNNIEKFKAEIRNNNKDRSNLSSKLKEYADSIKNIEEENTYLKSLVSQLQCEIKESELLMQNYIHKMKTELREESDQKIETMRKEISENEVKLKEVENIENRLKHEKIEYEKKLQDHSEIFSKKEIKLKEELREFQEKLDLKDSKLSQQSELENRVKQLINDQNSLQFKFESLEKESRVKDTQIFKISEENSRNLNKIHLLTEENQRKSIEIKQLTLRNDELQSRNASLSGYKSKLEALEQEATLSNSKHQEVQSELEKISFHYNEINSQYEVVVEEKERLTHKLNQSDLQSKKLAEEISRLKKKINSLQSEIEDFELSGNESAQVQEENNSLKNKLRSLTANHENIYKDYLDLKSRNSLLEKENCGLLETIEQVKYELIAKDSDIANLKNTFYRLETERNQQIQEYEESIKLGTDHHIEEKFEILIKEHNELIKEKENQLEQLLNKLHGLEEIIEDQQNEINLFKTDNDELLQINDELKCKLKSESLSNESLLQFKSKEIENIQKKLVEIFKENEVLNKRLILESSQSQYHIESKQEFEMINLKLNEFQIENEKLIKQVNQLEKQKSSDQGLKESLSEANKKIQFLECELEKLQSPPEKPTKQDDNHLKLSQSSKQLSLFQKFSEHLINLVSNNSTLETLADNRMDEEILQAFPELVDCYCKIEETLEENYKFSLKLKDFEQVFIENQHLKKQIESLQNLKNSEENLKKSLSDALKRIQFLETESLENASNQPHSLKNDQIHLKLAETSKQLLLFQKFSKKLINLVSNNSGLETLYEYSMDEEILQALPELVDCYLKIEESFKEKVRISSKFQEKVQETEFLKAKVIKLNDENRFIHENFESEKMKNFKEFNENKKQLLNELKEQETKLLKEFNEAKEKIVRELAENQLNDDQNLKNEYQELLGKFNDCQAQLAQVTQDKEKALSELETVRKNAEDLLEENENFKYKVNNQSSEDFQIIASQIIDYKEFIEELKSENNELKHLNDILKEQKYDLRQQLSQMIENPEEKTKDELKIQEYENRINELMIQTQAAKEENHKLLKVLQDYSESIKELTESNSQYLKDLNKQDEFLRRIDDEKLKILKELNEKTNSIKEINTEKQIISSELKHLQDTQNEMNDRNHAILKEKQEEVQHFKTTTQRLQQEINEIKENFQNQLDQKLAENAEKLLQELQNAARDKESLKLQLDEYEKNQKTLEKTVLDLQNERKQLFSDFQLYEKEKAKLLKELNIKSIQINKYDKELLNLCTELEFSKNSLEDLESLNNQYSGQIDDLTQENSNLHQQLQEKEIFIKTIETNQNLISLNKNQSFNSQTDQVLELKAQIEKYQQELEDYKNNQTQLIEKLREKENDLRLASINFSQLGKRLENESEMIEKDRQKLFSNLEKIQGKAENRDFNENLIFSKSRLTHLNLNDDEVIEKSKMRAESEPSFNSAEESGPNKIT